MLVLFLQVLKINFDRGIGAIGLAAEDERTGQLACIDFNSIKGDKGLDTQSEWFMNLNNKISK